MEDWHIPEEIPAPTYVDGHEIPHQIAAVVRRGWITGLVYAALQLAGLALALSEQPATARLVVGGLAQVAFIVALALGVRRWHFLSAVVLACDPFVETVWFFWATGPQPAGVAHGASLPYPVSMIFLIPISVLLGRAAIAIRHVRRAIAPMVHRRH